MGLREDFAKNVRRLGIERTLSDADVILCGFSGGADSTAMLHLIRTEYPGKDVRAVHVNHMIRGDEADRDEAHCRSVCASLGVAIEVRRIDVPALAAKEKLGLEQAARNARYAVFGEILDGIRESGKSAVIATAHSADDNLETMLFNLIRGSGTRGLGGIVPERDGFVRPMLCFTAAQIRDFCRENGYAYVTDGTNADTAYTRNLIRSEVIPHLREIAPSCAESSVSAAILLRRDDAYLDSLARSVIGDESGGASAPLDALRAADDVVLSRAILMMHTAARGERTDFGSVHIGACAELIRRSDFGELSLPGKTVMHIGNGRVTFSAAKEKHAAVPFESVLGDDFEGKCEDFFFPEAGFMLRLCDGRLNIPEFSSEIENIYKISIHTSVRFDKIKGTLAVRSRRPGDVILRGGMHKSVRKLMSSAHIEDRDSLPVICDSEGILYIPYIGCRDGSEDRTGGGLTITIRRSI